MKHVCVFCASSDGARPEYRAEASRLGRLLGERGLELVYGGASVGLMGAVADEALAAGARVVGVLPEVLREREIAHPGLTELHYVGSMHARKALMAERADAFVALPGGFGTLDEFLEIVTWALLGIHAKPCVMSILWGISTGCLRFSITRWQRVLRELQREAWCWLRRMRKARSRWWSGVWHPAAKSWAQPSSVQGPWISSSRLTSLTLPVAGRSFLVAPPLRLPLVRKRRVGECLDEQAADDRAGLEA